MTTLRTFEADDLHPMRFLRRFPEGREIVRREARHCQTGLLNFEAFQRVVDTGMHAYNRTLTRLPFDQRPTTMDVATGAITTITHLIYFTAAGRNTFRVSPELTSLLQQTELGDIRLSDMHLPFKSFYIDFAGGLTVGLPGPVNAIDGAYVECFADFKRPAAKQLSFYITSRRRDGGHSSPAAWITRNEPHFFAPLTVDRDDDTLQAALDRAIATNEISLSPDPAAAAALKEGIAEAQRSGLPVKSSSPNGYERTALFNEAAMPTARHVLALLCNVLCYLSSKPLMGEPQWPREASSSLVEASREAETPKRRRTAIGQLADEGYFPIRDLKFQGVAADREDDRYSVSISDGRDVATHWRRGHWRRQAYGSGLNERRLTWIRPVLVRKDRGEPAFAHVYPVNV